MNSFILASSSYPLTWTSAYTVLRSKSEKSMPIDRAYKSSSWRKFIRATAQQSEFDSAVTVIPAARTTTEGQIVLKTAPLPENYDEKIEEFLHFLDSFESEAGTTDNVTAEQ